MDPQYLVVQEVAELLRVNRTTVIHYAKRGLIPAKKIGYVWRIPRGEFEKWLQGTDTKLTRKAPQR